MLDKISVVDDQNGILPMWIGGRKVLAASGKTVDIVNPASGEPIAQSSVAGHAEVDMAVATASATFESRIWRSKTADEKARILWRIADLVELHGAELLEMEISNLGSARYFCQYLVTKAAESFRYYAGWTSKITGQAGDVSSSGVRMFAHTRKQPIGVVGLITPWNFPLMAAAWKIAPALAAGCSIVLKPALETPLSTLRLAELIEEAGVPAGVVNIVTGDAEAGAAIAAHPLIRKISFTGSGVTAKKVVEASAGNLKRLTLELGGKSPLVIFPDADLEKAAQAAASVMFVNSGQACVAGTRLYIHSSIYDEVVERIKAVIQHIKIGDAKDADTMMGPLVSQRHLNRVLELVESGRAQGATIAFGGEPVNRPGYFLPPTLITGATRDMRVMQEEIFGPVVCAQPFDDLDALMPELNASEYGLASYIWSQNTATVERFVEQIEAGNVYVNNGGYMDYGVPFGGFKQSGYGYEHGAVGLEAYLETKAVFSC
ncbi:aldehyde dehydrogenase family protein [Rhizobium sp. FY34]|uniref:aldehyde dehydrogenase family protein n=1 Tax=Rhizobium sp. FY34 TaxID=2562309 RepID=UPI001484D38C|nr:aldehyde dehydrogenase family protein [Rhizobium sp. FY34]